MFLLEKKKIIYIISCLIISLILVQINGNEDYIMTSSTPVSNHVIILDAGHGLPDGGAVANDGTYESGINLSIVKKLQSLLELSNCTVILTRSDENGIYELNSKTIREKKVSDMKNRVNIGNNSEAELFVSIHLNKIDVSSCAGWQSFYKPGDTIGEEIATSIQNNLNFAIQKNNKREIGKIGNIYLAKNLEIPFVIVECGFLSNSSECDLLKTDEYQEKLAWGIYTGIMDYFK